MFFLLACVCKLHIPFDSAPIHPQSQFEKLFAVRGCVNTAPTVFREIFGLRGFECRGGGNARLYLGCLYVSCVSLGALKVPIMPLLKFMFLEYWEEGGGRVNQSLVKVMFQWKEPTMPALIPPPPPRSDPILWLVQVWRKRTRGPACSYTQPGIRQPGAPGLSAN